MTQNFTNLKVVTFGSNLDMKITKISAITIITKNMKDSCMFYSSIPKFEISYGGPDSDFTTFKISQASDMYLNIESYSYKQKMDKAMNTSLWNNHHRIIFHTEDVDALYYYLRNDETVSNLGKFETKPTDATWGERYFQMHDPNGYEIVFATPIT